MNRFIKLTLSQTGDPIYIAVDKIVSINRSQNPSEHEGTIVGIMRDIYPYFVVKESPDTVISLIHGIPTWEGDVEQNDHFV